MPGHILVATILGHHVSSLGIYFWVIKYKGKVLGWALLSLGYHIFNFFEIPNVYLILLPPTNEVAGRLCFAGVCDSVHRWGPSVPLHAGIHPQEVHLPPGTPPGRYTHPWQVHPLTGIPPGAVHAGIWSRRGPVRIPLECNLVTSCNEVVAKVMFLLVSVILLTGVCLPQCMLGYHPGSRHPPPKQTPSGADPQEQTPPRSRHPPEQTPPEQTPQSRPPRADPPEQTPLGADTSPGADTPLEQTPPKEQTPPPHPPGADTPPPRADSGIRSMSGRYASTGMHSCLSMGVNYIVSVFTVNLQKIFVML